MGARIHTHLLPPKSTYVARKLTPLTATVIVSDAGAIFVVPCTPAGIDVLALGNVGFRARLVAYARRRGRLGGADDNDA